MPHTASHTGNPALDQCIDDCQHCATSCHATVAYCLEKGGKHAEAQHIALLIDCATICETAAGSMARQSTLHPTICGACAEICRACEQSCRAMGNDRAMQECADACRKCAESCEKMAV